MFSSPVPGTDSHLSFPIIALDLGGERGRGRRKPNYPPVCQAAVPREARGKPGADEFAPIPAAPRLQHSQAGTVPRAKAWERGWEEEEEGAPHPNDKGGKKAAVP